MSKVIMSIDQGTTGTTVSLWNQAGGLVASADQDFRQIFPRPGWVEHDPEDIWQSVQETCEAVLRKAGYNGSEIAAIGITNQRETSVVWNRKTSRPLMNAIVWQCRRTESICQKIRKSGKAKWIQKKTGLVVDPYFSATKIQWILKNVPNAIHAAKTGELAAGTIDTFLLWRLTGGIAHKTDVSNASRMMLMNIETTKWDKELLKFFNISESMLPSIENSSGTFGTTKGLGFLPDGIPITGIAGDQQAALFGQTCYLPGEAKCTFGTGSFLLMNTGSKLVRSKANMLTTVAWRLPKEKTTYAIEGGAFVCGAAVQWLRDGLQVIEKSQDIEELAMQEPDSAGVEFVPALTGMGAPYWWPDARGMITGLTRGANRAHIARATLDAMALQNVDILKAMEKDLKKKLKSVKVDGGATQNRFLMQLQADYLGVPVHKPVLIETTSMGAAYLAGLGVGFWSSKEDLKKVWQLDQTFDVHITKKQRDERLAKWHLAVQKLAK